MPHPTRDISAPLHTVSCFATDSAMDNSRSSEEETVSGKDATSFGSTAGLNLSGCTVSNVGNASQNTGSTASDAYMMPSSAYSYAYPGYSGSYLKWNNHGYYIPNEESRLSYPMPLLKPCSNRVGASERNLPIQKTPSTFQGHTGYLLRDTSANFRSNSRLWLDNKVSDRQKVNQRRHSEGFCDVICGPRANRRKGLLNTSEDQKSSELFLHVDRYNLPDFPIKYEHARFFMIKSYNEDDVHKSIKYSVWASTPSGNKKLDEAFHDAEARMKEGASKCPIFLFFSVNTSGQFVGVAEMTGHVDFKKSMDFWQEERWNGFFPARWHIVKDVPNLEFRSIILENNDNRPVFFSRDTQEIRLPQGLKMLQIFKNYPKETSILEDFSFYDAREKALRARRGCIPSLVQPAGNAGRSFASVMDLEEAMQKIDLSSRSKSHRLI